MGLNALAGVTSARVDLIEIQRESFPVGDCVNRVRPARSSARSSLAFFGATPTLTSRQGDADRETYELKRGTKRVADGKSLITSEGFETAGGFELSHSAFQNFLYTEKEKQKYSPIDALSSSVLKLKKRIPVWETLRNVCPKQCLEFVELNTFFLKTDAHIWRHDKQQYKSGAGFIGALQSRSSMCFVNMTRSTHVSIYRRARCLFECDSVCVCAC